MNIRYDCVNVMSPAITVGQVGDWGVAERARPASAVRAPSALVQARSEVLEGVRSENYVWLVLALSSLSVLVLSLWR
jgi:hypothetical protein